MNIKKIFCIILLLGFAGTVFGDGGYASSAGTGEDYRSPGKACWWTQRDDIEYPVRIEVMDSSVGLLSNFRGSFGVGGIGPLYVPLARNFHWPDSLAGQHFVLNIDGIYYSFANYTSAQLNVCGTPQTLRQIDDYFQGTDTSTVDGQVQIRSHWRIPVLDGFIDFYQYIRPVFMVFGPDSCGMARIHFRAINNHYESHSVGIKMMMDVYIGTGTTRDRPKVMIAGSYTELSQTYTAPVPAYWQGADETYYYPGITVARGVLRGGDATPPDYFIIGDQMGLWRHIWVRTDCEPDSTWWMETFPGFATGDAAFLIQWNPYSIPAGGNFNWITYYGFGSFYVPPSEIEVSLILPDISCHDCMLDTLVEASTIIAQHDDLGATYYNDTICLYPPSPLEIDSVYWDTTIVGGEILSDNCVLFDSLPPDVNVSIGWWIYVPPDLHLTGLTGEIEYYANSGDVTTATDSFETITVPMFSGIGPTMELLNDTLMYFSCTTFTVDIRYTEDDLGIDQSSVLPSVNGYSSDDFLIWDTPIDPMLDTFHIFVPGTLFTVDSVGSALVVIPPIADACGCLSPDTLRTLIYWDDQPPVLTDMSPPDSGYVNTPNPDISFTICDSVSGIQIDSIDFYYSYGSDIIELTSRDFGIVRIPNSDTSCVEISFTPTDIPSETTVTVCVTRALDFIDPPCSPNVMDTICWSFLVDYTGPRVEFIEPPDTVAYVSCDTPEVCFVVEDMNGLLTEPCESLEVWIGSTVYDACDPNMSISGDTVCILDVYNSPYSSGATVDITIMHLSDTLGNSADAVGYSFEMDTEGPWVSVVDPLEWSFVNIPSPSSPVCSILVNDDLSGIGLDYVTIRMSINDGEDTVLTYPEDMVFTSGWLSIFTDLSDADYLDTVCFTLDTIFDNAQVCPPNIIDPPFEWCYVIDNQPPEAELVQPEEGAVWACDVTEGWICIDFIDVTDVESGSIVVTVGNSSPVSTGWIYYSDVNRYCGPIPVDAEITSCEPIPIIIMQVADTLGNVASYSDTFYIVSDLEPPYVGLMYPDDTTLAYDSIAIEIIDDCSPIIQSQTCFDILVRNMGTDVVNLEVCGDNSDINWHPGPYSSTDTAFFFVNSILDSVGMALSNGDSIYICVTQSSDTLDDNSCGYNQFTDTTCLDFFYSLGGPSISIVEPPSGSAISCESLCVTFATQDSDGVDSSTVYLSYQINSGPVQIATIESSFVTWVPGTPTSAPDNIIICIPDMLMDGDEIFISVDSLDDMLGVPTTTGRSGTYWIDWEPPNISNYWPSDGEEIETAQPLIWVTANDLIAGINQETACFTFNSTVTYCWDDSIVYWSGDGDTVYFSSVEAGEFFSGGDTIQVCLELADNAILCDSNYTEYCWEFSIAAGGPLADAVEPTESSIVTCDTIYSLIITAYDTNGVDWNTFHIIIDGPGSFYYDISYPDPALTLANDTLTADAIIAEEGTVWVTIEVQDSLGNDISGGSYEYWFVIDHSAPVIVEYIPLCDSTAIDIPETLWVIAEDPFGYPDPDLFCVGIIDTAGDTIRICGDETGAIGSNLDTIFVILDSLDLDFHGGDTIVWWIEQLADYSDMCTPNFGLTGDTCTIPISATGPAVELIEPIDINGDGYIYFGCEYPYIFQFTLDDPEGYDTSSICIYYFCIDSATGDTISRENECWPDPDLSLSGDTLLWDVLTFPCPEGNELHITVEVMDNLMNPQRPNNFIVIIDTSAPGFEIISPAPEESVLTLTPVITLGFPDPAGPDTNLICVELQWGGSTLEVCNSGDTITWSYDTLFLHTPPGLFSTGDTVTICVDSVWDAADACPNSALLDTCYWVFIAQGGPEVIITYPIPDSVGLICANDTFIFVFSDPNGLDTTTVHFADDGTEYPIGSNPYWADETTLVYVPSSPYSWSPVEISIWGHQDMLGYESDSIVFTLDMDVQPPTATWVSPGSPPEPITIPPGTPIIQIEITDSLNLVDSTTILLCTHGLDEYCYPVDAEVGIDDTLTWDWFEGMLTYFAEFSNDTFLAGDYDSVCLIVGDDPNCGDYYNLDTICWSYNVSAAEGPTPTLIIPTPDSATIACTDSFFIAWSCITSIGLRHSNAEISMQIGSDVPVTYDDASGRISYSGDTLFFSPDMSEPFSDGDTLTIQILHIEDALGNPTEDPETYTYTFFIDWSGPALIDASPVGLSLDPSPTIWFYFEDISEIDTMSSVVTITVAGETPTTYRITDTEMFWNMDTLFIDGLSFAGGDSVIVCLDSIADIPDTCGPNWTTDTCFTFWLPQGGPLAELVIPIDSTTTFCEDQNIVIALCDSQGILLDSLRFYIQHRVSGVTDSFDADHITNLGMIDHILDTSGTTFCDTIIVPPLSSFADGETVIVTLERAMDTLFNPSFPYQWMFVVDLSPPIADNYVPAMNETVYNWSQHISVQVWDVFSWLDTIALAVEILDNGSLWFTFRWDSTQLWYDNSDSTVHIQIDTLWQEFHQYCINIFAQDTTDTVLCPANDTVFSWCFYVGDDDSIAPEITLEDSCFWPGMVTDFYIACTLSDSSGIYDDATDTAGQGIFVVYDTTNCPEMETGDFLGIEQMVYTPVDSYWGTAITPTGAFPQFPPGTHLYYIIYAYDNDFDFENELDRAQAYSVCGTCYFHDIDPPTIWAIDPDSGYFYSCTCGTQELLIGMHDYDGVSIDAGTLAVNSISYPLDTTISPQISFSGNVGMPGTVYVHFTPQECWEHYDTISVDIWGWQDIYENLYEDSIYHYDFVVDWEPPEVYYENCAGEGDTNLYLEEFDTIVIQITDQPAGVEPDSIQIVINGKHISNGSYPSSYDYTHIYTIADNGVEYDSASGELELIIPRLPYLEIENMDSLWIVVGQVCDISQSCGPNCVSDAMTCPRYIVAEFECRTHPNPFTPNNDGSNDELFIQFPKMVFRDATVYIYDMAGIEIKKITVGDAHTYVWDGTDSQGNDCRPGVYLYVIKVDGEVICTGSFVLAR
ncbi:hypothetical protein DRQ33_00035 [bacterium]|nr:MAG: hypothetical protein DRQ33_00035 [bacterium]